MTYAEMKRRDMQDHLEMEEKFCPLNIRQPQQRPFWGDLVYVFALAAICFLGMFDVLSWFSR